MSDNKKNCYLFVHFREKSTPDGEQVYFGISRDGYHWEEVYGGKPILWVHSTGNITGASGTL